MELTATVVKKELSDGSEVFGVQVQDIHGYGVVFDCPEEAAAVMLIKTIDDCTLNVETV